MEFPEVSFMLPQSLKAEFEHTKLWYQKHKDELSVSQDIEFIDAVNHLYLEPGHLGLPTTSPFYRSWKETAGAMYTLIGMHLCGDYLWGLRYRSLLDKLEIRFGNDFQKNENFWKKHARRIDFLHRSESTSRERPAKFISAAKKHLEGHQRRSREESNRRGEIVHKNANVSSASEAANELLELRRLVDEKEKEIQAVHNENTILRTDRDEWRKESEILRGSNRSLLEALGSKYRSSKNLHEQPGDSAKQSEPPQQRTEVSFGRPETLRAKNAVLSDQLKASPAKAVQVRTGNAALQDSTSEMCQSTKHLTKEHGNVRDAPEIERPPSRKELEALREEFAAWRSATRSVVDQTKKNLARLERGVEYTLKHGHDTGALVDRHETEIRQLHYQVDHPRAQEAQIRAEVGQNPRRVLKRSIDEISNDDE